MMVSGATFAKYDELEGQIAQLQTCDRDQEKAASDVNTSRAAMAQVDSQIHHTVNSKAKLDKRIHRNENPRFLHYFVINRKSKVERLKTEREGLIESEGSLRKSRESHLSVLSQREQVLSQANNVVQRRNQLSSEKQQIFDQVVDTYPTQRLAQIKSNIAAQHQAISQENSLVQRIDGVLAQLSQGRSMYERSMQTLREAQSLNFTARVLNRAEMTEEDFRAEKQRMERAERDFQLRRDNLINQAQGPANDAFMVIQTAWQTFPAEARARYPSLCAQIGQTPLPRLEKACGVTTLVTDALFGDVGQAINNATTEAKIQRNMQVVQQCLQILSSQAQLVQALRAGILVNVDTMTNQIRVMEAQKEEERKTIFQNVRSQFMIPQMSYGQAPPMPGMQPAVAFAVPSN